MLCGVIATLFFFTQKTAYEMRISDWSSDVCSSDLQIGFPVWCSFFTPSDIVSRWMPDRFGEPVTIGTVTVCSGDYVIADRDGIVILPAAMAADVEIGRAHV